MIKEDKMQYFTLWEKAGKRRLYLKKEGLGEALQLEIYRYNTGNISYSRALGQDISHAQADRLLKAYVGCFYDLDAKKWTFMYGRLPLCDELRKFFEDEPSPYSVIPDGWWRQSERSGKYTYKP